MIRFPLAAFVFAAVAAGPAAGQRLEKPLPHWEPSLQSTSPVRAPQAPIPDYRWEGLAVGGAFLGILGGVAGNGFCSNDDSAVKRSCVLPTLEGFVVGAVVGGVTGGLLGSAIRKPPGDEPGHP